MSDSATPWTVVHQAPLSMGFPRPEYWSGLPFPPPGELPESRLEPMSLALAGRFFTVEPLGKPHFYHPTALSASVGGQSAPIEEPETIPRSGGQVQVAPPSHCAPSAPLYRRIRASNITLTTTPNFPDFLGFRNAADQLNYLASLFERDVKTESVPLKY